MLTLFGKNTAGPHELAAERFSLLNTPFEDYERSIRDDHGMTMPTPGHLFGNGADRKSSPRHIAAAPRRKSFGTYNG